MHEMLRWIHKSGSAETAFPGATILHLNAKLKKAALPRSACFSQVAEQI